MPKLASHLQHMLSAPVMEALKTAGALAGSQTAPATEVYLVGGPVRDILLGLKPKDLDLTVVGDGEQFARAFAAAAGGQVVQVSEFGTARVELPSGPVDIATARSEYYPGPASLPRVTPAGLREDLGRRDFSVNALAVAIWPARWGELVDPFGGFSDIARRRLRILHDRSFEDDPTRILRGVRYAARLGFTFDPLTFELLDRDKALLDRLSPARVRAELEKLLHEPARAQALRLAESYGVLAAIHPALRTNARALGAMEGPSPAGDDRLLYDLALLSSAFSESEGEAIITRLSPPNEWRDIINAWPKYRPIASVLDRKDLSPSEVVSLLEPFPVPVVQALHSLAPNTLQKEHLGQFLTRFRTIRPETDGDALLVAGVPQGPAVGALLAELKAARLDGKVTSKQEELDLVRRRLPDVLRRMG